MRNEYLMYYVCSRDFIYYVKKENYNVRSNYFCQLSELRTQSLTTVFIFVDMEIYQLWFTMVQGSWTSSFLIFVVFWSAFYIWRVYISLNDIFIVFCYMPSTPVRENYAQWKKIDQGYCGDL